MAQTKAVQSPDLIQGLITRRNITIVSSCREKLGNIDLVDAAIEGGEEDDWSVQVSKCGNTGKIFVILSDLVRLNDFPQMYVTLI